MIQREPIEQLHGLLREQKNVAEKANEVQTTLDAVKNHISASMAQECMSQAGAVVRIKEELMKEEQTYERLLQALRDMQAQIEERVRPVAEQVVQAEVERLRNASEQQKSVLVNCLAQIDQTILSCRSHLNAYQQTRTDLAALNERLVKLGADPTPIPKTFPMENLGDMIRARVDGLRSEGRI